MDAITLLIIILIIFMAVIGFWAVYYLWVIYNFIRSFVRDIIRKLR
ncbi:MAG: hypothetical protein KJ955_05850 [Nanoarchaeota archaeon]|nr:hypothetical protein [Nanoarchaeota archaeon]